MIQELDFESNFVVVRIKFQWEDSADFLERECFWCFYPLIFFHGRQKMFASKGLQLDINGNEHSRVSRSFNMASVKYSLCSTWVLQYQLVDISDWRKLLLLLLLLRELFKYFLPTAEIRQFSQVSELDVQNN